MNQKSNCTVLPQQISDSIDVLVSHQPPETRIHAKYKLRTEALNIIRKLNANSATKVLAKKGINVDPDYDPYFDEDYGVGKNYQLEE